MPPDDPMFPPGASIYKRQMASRMFYMILLFDTFVGCLWAGWTPPLYAFPAGSYDTSEPLNYASNDLLLPHARPKHLSEPTDVVFELHQFRILTHLRDIVSHTAHKTDYPVVLRIDRELRQDLDQLLAMKLAREDMTDNECIGFTVTNSSYTQRLLRLHRAWFLRSYTEEGFEYSRESVLSGARQMLNAHRNLFRKYGHKAAVRNGHYIYYHHLSSIIFLFVHALYTPELRQETKQEMIASRDLFVARPLSFGKRRGMQTVISERIQSAIRIMDVMIETIEKPLDLKHENIRELLQRIQTNASESCWEEINSVLSANKSKTNLKLNPNPMPNNPPLIPPSQANTTGRSLSNADKYRDSMAFPFFGSWQNTNPSGLSMEPGLGDPAAGSTGVSGSSALTGVSDVDGEMGVTGFPGNPGVGATWPDATPAGVAWSDGWGFDWDSLLGF
ncbi:hypothetical protein M231_02901 [Tremella mesenterica]|uniref:Uncharacterized protein n=1 Tax=Tremella mesenterica TaxID=5217 RepID=A0A4Q1BPK5_TREME|nr:hypothetical protein M231_02901 [Tremella mesenterica]